MELLEAEINELRGKGLYEGAPGDTIDLCYSFPIRGINNAT